ncbi:MAG: MAPEG family protein [SAR324 cluster bacterium]|nr:MAPEG family protein [SAR324 cluster bacterium]
MTTALYTSILSTLICMLSLNVIKVRRKHEIAYGDGGNEELQIARSAQGNALDYIPIALILLFVLEYNQANLLLVHLLGMALVIGRIIHSWSILHNNFKGRVKGMQITFLTILFLAILNLIYLPYGQLF